MLKDKGVEPRTEMFLAAKKHEFKEMMKKEKEEKQAKSCEKSWKREKAVEKKSEKGIKAFGLHSTSRGGKQHWKKVRLIK